MPSIDTITATGERLPAGTRAPRDARFRARWRTPSGASRTRTFGRKLDAERFLTAMEHDKLAGRYVDPSLGRQTFGEYAQAWADRQPHRASTREHVSAVLDRYILPKFGGVPLAGIRPSDVQAFVSGLSKTLAPSTVEVAYGKLAAILGAAAHDGLIVTSPCGRHIKRPRAEGREVVPMNPAEVAAVVSGVPVRYRALVVLLAGTGLRPSEGTGLTLDRVDFLRRQLRVDRQLITLPGAAPTFGPPKTPSSVRTIPVPDSVLSELGHHLAQFATGTEGLIFTDGKGDPIRRNALGHVWRRALASINADHVVVRDFTPHDLRHYAASVLIAAGASVKAVQRHLGHTSATTTLDTYAHLWPDSEDATRVALEEGISRAVSRACYEVAR